MVEDQIPSIHFMSAGCDYTHSKCTSVSGKEAAICAIGQSNDSLSGKEKKKKRNNYSLSC